MLWDSVYAWLVCKLRSQQKRDKVVITQALWPLNKGPPLKFGSASEFSALGSAPPHGSADPLHWDERDSMIIDQPLHIAEVSSLHMTG